MQFDHTRLTEQTNELIEKGRLAEIEIRTREEDLNRAMVSYQAAQAALAAQKSKVDEQGNSIGDVASAQAQADFAAARLSMAQTEYQRASNHLQMVRDEQSAHVNSLQSYQDAASRNISKLSQLKSMAFGENAMPAINGMTSNYNSVEQSRVRLLQAMGVSATVSLLQSASGVSASSGWSPVSLDSFSLDTSSSSGTGRNWRTENGSYGDRGQLALDPGQPAAAAGNMNGSFAAAPQEEWDFNSSGYTRGRKRSRSSGERVMNPQALVEQQMKEILDYLSSDQVSREEKLEWIRNNWGSDYMQRSDSQVNASSLLETMHENAYQASVSRLDSIIDFYTRKLDAAGYKDSSERRQVLQSKREELQNMLVGDILRDTDNLANESITQEKLEVMMENIDQLVEERRRAPIFSDHRVTKFQSKILSGEAGLKEVQERGREAYRILEKEGKERKEKIAALVKTKNSIVNTGLKTGGLTADEKEQIYRIDQQVSVLKNGQSIMKRVISKYRKIGPGKNLSYDVQRPDGAYANTSRTARKMENVLSNLPRGWSQVLDGLKVTLYGSERAFTNASEIENGKVTFNLGGMRYDTTTIAIHEFCHLLEQQNPAINKVLNDFFDSRIKDQKLKKLKDINSNYGDNEFYYEGNPPFINPYMGKVYPKRGDKREHFELLSMGVEFLFADPSSLDKDPEYRDIILGILTSL